MSAGAGPAPPRPGEGARGAASWRGLLPPPPLPSGKVPARSWPRAAPARARAPSAPRSSPAARRPGRCRRLRRAGGMEEAHLLPAADVLRRFSVTAEGGLSPAQVTRARERYGPNGENAARAGAAGAPRAAVSVSPQAPRPRSGPLPSEPYAPAGGRAGRKRGLRKPLQMLLGLPEGCAAPWRGRRVRVPGSETGRPLPRPALLPPGPGTSEALPGFPPLSASASTRAGLSSPPPAVSAASPRRRHPPCQHLAGARTGRLATDQPGIPEAQPAS